jgi:L-2-hydroxyglutarate oxidase
MTCRLLVGCAGLQADRVARLSGVDPGVQIVPFRGEYYALRPERRHLVRNLIYPVPDPRFPFLGVHFTRNVQGEIDAGPNAVLAFRREGYTRWQISVSDMVEMCTYGGFWRFLLKHLTTGAGELYRSFRRKAFLRAMQRLIPEVQDADIVPYGAGVRAQALDPRGRLVDDFHVVEADRMIHVLNAPSPAATASLSVGAVIAGKARQRFQNTVMPRLFRPCG